MDSIIFGKKEAWEKLEKDFITGLMWGFPVREPKEDDNIKLAWVEIDGKNKIIGVDNKTLKGYQMTGIYYDWKLPLEEQIYDKFIRWCTTFDM